MKILVLSNFIDFQKVGYFSLGLMSKYTELKDVVFDETIFSQYMIVTKQDEKLTKTGCILAALVTGNKISKEKDIIVFGNTTRDVKFDLILKVDEKYNDVLLSGMQELFKDDEVLNKLIPDLYKDEDATMKLTLNEAGQDFLYDYFTSGDLNELNISRE